jgi:uncharacterized protein (UPF0147 family)
MALDDKSILIELKSLGADLLVDKIIQDPTCPEAISYSKAKRILNSPLKKMYVEASFLASENLEEISDVLEIPVEVLESYRTLIYDVKGLDKLSKMELLNGPNKEENNLKLWATSVGLDFLKWRLGKQVNISPVDGLQDLYTMCVFKSKEALFNGNISDASKESTKYIKLSMDIARLIKVWVLDSAAAKKDIELALMEVVPEFGGYSDLDREKDFANGVTEFEGFEGLNNE